MFFRILLAILFIAAGSLHFLLPQTYIRIMPPYIPAHEMLVHISGLCEILGGLGLLFHPPIRTLAAWGLVALLIAVMPANIYMATDHASYPSMPVWALYLRLPLQLPLIWWAWLYTRR
ncbi:putative membrane protein [Granulicella aggregans]|uniref:Putative membrane protein n=1 Tax=Granulicella aggregans TaxID=474949 RepID=A0A7W7ZBG8_9BACT|nr:DoxX family protein [Granulicella aggregans]MBB5056697.1 putative membrane protein [Granulicella aggregans]